MQSTKKKIQGRTHGAWKYTFDKKIIFIAVMR